MLEEEQPEWPHGSRRRALEILDFGNLCFPVQDVWVSHMRRLNFWRFQGCLGFQGLWLIQEAGFDHWSGVYRL